MRLGAERTGSLIGAIFGLVFIVWNASEFSDSRAQTVVALGFLAFVAVLWFAVVSAPSTVSAPLDRGAVRTYWTCVIVEVIAIPVGANVLTRVLDVAYLVPLWIGVVVGVHFLPFSKAFGLPMFARLGWTMIAIAVVGAVLATTVRHDLAAVFAVLEGVALLVAAASPRLARVRQ